MNNLTFGFWISLIGCMVSMVYLPLAPLMLYLVIISMTFLTGIFVLKGAKEYIAVAIATALHYQKHPEELKKGDKSE